MASKNLRYSEAVLVSHVGSLIDARILCLTVKNGCISNYIITYKMMNNCLLIIFQQALFNTKRTKKESKNITLISIEKC